MMRTYSFVLLGVAFSAMAAYGEPIDLGCNARGPLAALENSAEFRDAIGTANPANFLSSVYDVNGQRLAPGFLKALQCPLFIDSAAEPSASESKAILRAELSAPANSPDVQATKLVLNQSITVASAAGIVDQIPQPEIVKAEIQEKPQFAPNEVTGRKHNRRVETAVVGLRHPKEPMPRETSKARQDLMVQASSAPSPAPSVEKKDRISTVVDTQNSQILSLAEATGLIRQSRNAYSGASLEINPVMALFDFVALFAAVLGFGVLLIYPGRKTFGVRSKSELYWAALNGLDARMPEPVRVAPRRPAAVSRSASGDDVPAWSLSRSASWR
jgi:hypothetical protein